MKVRDLIELLSEFDEDADVILGIQPSWPFEHRIKGLVQRRDFTDPEPEDYRDGEPEGDSGYRDSFTTRGKPNDVVICEGGQIRYGSRDMFDAC